MPFVSVVGSSFKPSDLSGLFLWLDASDTSTITHTSNSVSQWDDKSGTSKNFTQGTGSQQPITNTRTINGLNVLDFDGSNDNLIGPSSMYPLMTSSFTQFWVYAADTTKRHNFYRSSDFSEFILDNNDVTGANNPAFVYATLSAVSPGTTQHAFKFIRNGASCNVYFDGTAGTANTAADNTVTTFTISSSIGVFALDGVLAEVIIYNSVLSAGDQTLVENYIKAKWGTP